MTDRKQPIGSDHLEAGLADLAAGLAFPPTPDLAAAVGARLRTPAVSGARGRTRPLRRSVPRALLLAAALALLVVGGAIAVRFGLELLSIEVGPVPTVVPSAATTPTDRAPARVGAGLGLGRIGTLDDVAAAAAFEVLLPAALGPPDAVFLGGPGLRGQVAMVYVATDDLPASAQLGGAGLLITQSQGEADDGLAEKLVDSGLATIESVDVAGAPGVWISGAPHVFWYLAPDGMEIEDSRRLVGDTLIWERGGVLYRVEGAISLERALEIAESMR